jgi:hypothetical protein
MIKEFLAFWRHDIFWLTQESQTPLSSILRTVLPYDLILNPYLLYKLKPVLFGGIKFMDILGLTFSLHL